MATFIFSVLKDLHSKDLNLSNLTFILPNKRAGVFLKHQLANVVEKTIFSPDIMSIEEFVEDLSEIKKVSNTELMFEFYTSYCKITPNEEQDTFETFSKWAQTLIQDFNEIDRFLVPQKKIFNYLRDIKRIESNHWSLDYNPTDLVKKYLSFWNKLYDYYIHFSEHLLNKKIGHQGLIYREAVENLEAYLQANPKKQHVFLGFNALNAAEESIFQELLQNDLAKIYWDIDQAFYNSPYHDAAIFFKEYKNRWSYFEKHNFNWITNGYSKKKHITVSGISRNVGQAKYIGTILKRLQKENGNLNNTALVLSDETLLMPVLNSLPDTVETLNITMGFPLRSVPLAALFEALFHIHKNAQKKIYYKDVISIITHQFIRPLFYKNGVDYTTSLIESIHFNNLIYITNDQLHDLLKYQEHVIDLLFGNWENNPTFALNNCLEIILEIKSQLDFNKEKNILPLEYAFRFNELFEELSRLNNIYRHLKDISSLHNIYKELLTIETLDFRGEPLQGLQIMGMLESRVLDFENIIIASVNEGILPSAKNQNSFIPYDVKLENNLPTYREKNAIFSYHFYRLLQRAKNVFILYNTEIDTLKGGEKSRFITQIEFESLHQIFNEILTPEVPAIKKHAYKIKKTDLVIEKIKQTAKKGFSPSSLTNYIRNPIDFYFDKILGIKDIEEVEETIAANTLGTVVHNTLEEFYHPFIGGFLTLNAIENMKEKIAKTVTKHFKEIYKEGSIIEGKNLIIFEIAKRYVLNIIDREITALKKGDQIKILAIEADNNVELNIPELDFPVFLTGKVDRVDEYNGVLRIIDYKTGKVEPQHIEITNWEDITTNYTKYSKSFQVLTYAYMINNNSPFIQPVEAGIISFKNLNKGFMKFRKKEGKGNNKNQLVSQETLDNYFIELKKLILEICNQDIDFIEKEI